MIRGRLLGVSSPDARDVALLRVIIAPGNLKTLISLKAFRRVLHCDGHDDEPGEENDSYESKCDHHARSNKQDTCLVVRLFRGSYQRPFFFAGAEVETVKT